MLNFADHEAALRSWLDGERDTLDGVVLCVGYLGDQAAAQADFAEARRIIETNLTGCVSLLNFIANEFETRRSGFICALGSVAGDRGRQSNYIYGAAKAGISAYCQGLRNRLAPHGVHVLTVKPGFVDTQMTWGRPGLFLVASPRTAARRIVAAVLKGEDQAYVPRFWRPVMLLIRLIPEKIFKRMRL